MATVCKKLLRSQWIDPSRIVYLTNLCRFGTLKASKLNEKELLQSIDSINFDVIQSIDERCECILDEIRDIDPYLTSTSLNLKCCEFIGNYLFGSLGLDIVNQKLSEGNTDIEFCYLLYQNVIERSHSKHETTEALIGKAQFATLIKDKYTFDNTFDRILETYTDLNVTKQQLIWLYLPHIMDDIKINHGESIKIPLNKWSSVNLEYGATKDDTDDDNDDDECYMISDPKKPDIEDILIKQSDTEQLIELSRTAEIAKRYEDMCQFVKQLVQLKLQNNQDLSVEERNLLSAGYKNVVGAKRYSYRELVKLDKEEELLNKYKAIIEIEIEAYCLEILDLTQSLSKTIEGNMDETEVFYLKQSGDFCRYICELRIHDIHDKYKKAAKQYYEKGMKIAQENLNETHPTRLGLALNLSVFYYEILEEKERACDLAKQSYDLAIIQNDTSSYNESALIIQLFRDNLNSWGVLKNENNDN